MTPQAAKQEEPQCIYHGFPITIKFYLESVEYWIGPNYMGRFTKESETGRILMEWRENEEK